MEEANLLAHLEVFRVAFSLKPGYIIDDTFLRRFQVMCLEQTGEWKANQLLLTYNSLWSFPSLFPT